MEPLTRFLIVVRRTVAELARVRWNDLRFDAADTALPVSYTHLTLPTNREV